MVSFKGWLLELLDLLSWFDWLVAFGWLVCLVSWVGRLGWDGWFDFKLVDNANLQAASYLRRRDQWIHTAYQRHFDTQRGRVQDRTRRTEAQKRGHLHDHICEYHEKCGLLFPGAGNWKRHCRSVSHVCLKTGEQCRLSQHCASSKRHQQNHSGEVIAELVRPYPIGSVSAGPPLLPKVRGSSRTETMSAIEMGMWSKDRTKDPSNFGFSVKCEGTFQDRFQQCMATYADGLRLNKMPMNTPLLLEDLLAGYYYRFVQIHVTVVHKCTVGSCRLVRWLVDW